jgi:hypothetical protein
LTIFCGYELFSISRLVVRMFAHLSTFLMILVQDTPLSYWLLESDGQSTTVFLALNLCCLIWYIVLEISSRRSAARKLDDTSTSGPTKIMRNFAPPGHRPTEARLNISSFHLAGGLASSTESSSEHALPISDISVDGPISTNALIEKNCTTAPKDMPVTLPPQGRNFSGLARAAPISYETLRQREMLDKNGSPTQKYAREKRLEKLMGGK